VCRPAPGGHNVGMIVMTTMRTDLADWLAVLA
jgi:hypothetical protein